MGNQVDSLTVEKEGLKSTLEPSPLTREPTIVDRSF